MFRDLAAALTVSTAAAFAAQACPVRALTALLLAASDEVGGVDEVDTYPAGLPEVEPEIASPPLRPGGVPTLPVEAPPSYQPPGYRPPTPVPPTPPPPTEQWSYKTALSGGHTTKDLYNTYAERDVVEIKFLFKKTTWDGTRPFDHFAEHDGVGYLAIGGTLPGSWFEDHMTFMEGEQDGPQVALKVYLANELSVEGYVIALFSRDDFGTFNVQEDVLGGKVGLHLKNGLSLWYGKEQYEVGADWGGPGQDWSYEWTTYGVDWLFGAGRQHFKVSLCKRDEPTEAFWFLGPFEETRMEFSWFPTRKLKLSSGLKMCPDGDDDSKFFSAKWDASRTISLGVYRETSDGLSDLEVTTFWAALRF